MHKDNYTLTLFFIVCLFIVYNRRQEIRNPPPSDDGETFCG